MPRLSRRALAFAFTPLDTPALRARVTRDLRLIVDEIARADPHARAVLLTGGFSRGEGSARNNEPLNDYDLVAVRDRPGAGALYRRLAVDLTAAVGLEVDLLPVWRARLPRVGRKLFWLDLATGGRVIAGDPTVLARLPRWSAADLDRREIARLLGNRAAGLLLALPAPGEAPDAAARDLQAVKAAIAALDATLLSRGIYARRLADRLALARDHPDHEVFAAAVAWKLSPGAPLPEPWWERARDALLRAVDATRARATRDGAPERVLHLVRARRFSVSPSQAVRRAAWDLLADATWPAGPPDVADARRRLAALGVRSPPDWGALRRGFFEARARTLQ